MKTLLTLSLLLVSTVANANLIKINPGKYFDYYHMKYELKAGQYQVNRKYGFNSGGQFEVFVPKEKFPISAPNCNKNIIIRMQASHNEKRKHALYQKLLNGDSVTVTLELNPYVTVINQSPLKLELQYCNVFFRHRGGDYYDSL